MYLLNSVPVYSNFLSWLVCISSSWVICVILTFIIFIFAMFITDNGSSETSSLSNDDLCLSFSTGVFFASWITVSIILHLSGSCSIIKGYENTIAITPQNGEEPRSELPISLQDTIQYINTIENVDLDTIQVKKPEKNTIPPSVFHEDLIPCDDFEYVITFETSESLLRKE